MDRAEKQNRFNSRKLISDARVRKIFTYMMQGCVFCELLVDTDGEPAGYSVAGYNDAMSALAGTSSSGDSESAVRFFLNQMELVPVLARVCRDRDYLVWEQYVSAGKKWYSISAFSLEARSVVLMIENISERKRLEIKLEEERKRYEALMKQSSDAVALVDVSTKRIIDVNLRLCQITGYSEDELCRMNIYNLLTGPNREIDECQSILANKRYLPVATRWIHCKDGSSIEMERVGSLIKHDAATLELLTFYDVSEERRLQQIINEDAALASQVQRQMLPRDFRNPTLTIAGIYKPLHMVSGDFFDYRFSSDQKTLTGFLVDVAGHGLAAALQTAAINVLLQDVILHEKMPTKSELHSLNKKMMGYFDESAFAALIIFHFDFARKNLTCACCGINKAMAFCRVKRGWMKAKGSIMGTFDDPEFDIVTIPIQSGDCYYFLTDGLSDILRESDLKDLSNFSATLRRLSGLTDTTEVMDDCSAVCIKINELTPYCRYGFSGMDDVEKLQKAIRRKLADIAGNQAVQLEIALNEAINNVLMHGSGEGHFSIKRIGRRIVMRVKDARMGFDAQAVLQPFAEKQSEEIAEELLSCETGRGVLIMKLFTDVVCYNRSGSEVLLVYRKRS